jgi:D-sedoheptulose 7-phosphate isomerase
MKNLLSIEGGLLNHTKMVSDIMKNDSLKNLINSVSEIIIESFKNNKKVLICGNGGSAADAQHIAAELSGRFRFDREPLFAEALHTNSSYLTAVANDYGYEFIYSRLLKCMGSDGDVLIGLSTSGNSKNIINAMIEAKKRKMIIVSFTGASDNEMEKLADFSIKIPSTDTARIQEGHILIGHIMCEIIENKLFIK